MRLVLTAGKLAIGGAGSGCRNKHHFIMRCLQRIGENHEEHFVFSNIITEGNSRCKKRVLVENPF